MIGEAYAGFYADELNSRQPIPADAKTVYRGVSQSGVERLAKLMRRKYGINVWVDGTVTTGWRLLVHAGDLDRASRMFKSVREGVMDMIARKAGATVDSQKWALELQRGHRIGYIRPRVREAGRQRRDDGGWEIGYDVDDVYLSDIHDTPSFYTWDEAQAVKRVFATKYGHIQAELRLVPESTFRARK